MFKHVTGTTVLKGDRYFSEKVLCSRSSTLRLNWLFKTKRIKLGYESLLVTIISVQRDNTANFYTNIHLKFVFTRASNS